MHFQETLEILSLQLLCIFPHSWDGGEPCAQHSTRTESPKLSIPVTLHPPVVTCGRGCTLRSCEVQAQQQAGKVQAQQQAGRNPAEMMHRTLGKHKEQRFQTNLAQSLLGGACRCPNASSVPSCNTSLHDAEASAHFKACKAANSVLVAIKTHRE